jgi:YD repeat-containing protein
MTGMSVPHLNEYVSLVTNIMTKTTDSYLKQSLDFAKVNAATMHRCIVRYKFPQSLLEVLCGHNMSEGIYKPFQGWNANVGLGYIWAASSFGIPNVKMVEEDQSKLDYDEVIRRVQAACTHIEEQLQWYKDNDSFVHDLQWDGAGSKIGWDNTQGELDEEGKEKWVILGEKIPFSRFKDQIVKLRAAPGFGSEVYQQKWWNQGFDWDNENTSPIHPFEQRQVTAASRHPKTNVFYKTKQLHLSNLLLSILLDIFFRESNQSETSTLFLLV